MALLSYVGQVCPDGCDVMVTLIALVALMGLITAMTLVALMVFVTLMAHRALMAPMFLMTLMVGLCAIMFHHFLSPFFTYIRLGLAILCTLAGKL